MDFIASRRSPGFEHPPSGEDVALFVDDARLSATLTVPPGARGLVVVLSDFGANRFGAHDTFAGRALEQAGLATLLVDPLISAAEPPSSALDARAQHETLVRRTLAIIDWLAQQPSTAALHVGLLFPAGYSAVIAAAALARSARVLCVVLRGSVPDGGAALATAAHLPSLSLAGVGFERAVELASDFFVQHLVEAFEG